MDDILIKASGLTKQFVCTKKNKGLANSLKSLFANEKYVKTAVDLSGRKGKV
jgi:ABC-type uncharacterized transport system ATPase subunit